MGGRAAVFLQESFMLAPMFGFPSRSRMACTAAACLGTLLAAAPPALAAGVSASTSSGGGQASVRVGSADHPVVMLPIMLILGGEYSWLRVAPDTPPGMVKPREPGEALLVKARLDLSQQRVSNAVDALDGRIEAGYGPWAVQGRLTRYREDEPGGVRDRLEVRQAHFLYRIAAGDYAELGVGYGRLQIVDARRPLGEGARTGDSATLPLLIHPSPYWGLEYRPTWAKVDGKTVRDQEIALSLGLPYLSLRVGYRRFESGVGQGGERLSGPFIGFSLRY
jgi:hypothetical protein